ncbi:MAG: hypothetical protein BIFFINMI_01732 [Phycisphaerae bacterium]|nr:hypothetical protein [Phycisphaerae bacterium]
MRTTLWMPAVLFLASAATAQTTQPYADDPAVVKLLTDLPANQVVALPQFKVTGDRIDGDPGFAKSGPQGRDYCDKMCYAPSRRTALFAGANHQSPSRLNDCWEYHLGSNTWIRLAAGDGGDHGAIRRARDAIKRGQDVAKQREFLTQWYTQYAEVADGHLRTRRNHGPVEPWHTWDGLAWDESAGRLLWAVLDNDAVMREKVKSYAEATGQDAAELEKRLKPGTGLYCFDPVARQWQRQLGDDPRPYLRGMGGSLTYIPDWKKTLWYCAAQNVSPNDFAMWTYDAAANAWAELKPNGGKSIRDLWGAKLVPGSECQMAYSPRHRKLVAVLEKETFVYDVATNAWSHATTVDDQYAHDAVTIFAYDSAADLFLLVNATKGHWGDARDLRGFDVAAGQWRKLPTEGKLTFDKRPYARQTGYYDPDHDVLIVYDGQSVRVCRVTAEGKKEQ